MNKNTTHVKQESNEIFCKEEIKIKQRYDKKTNVEQTQNNQKIYFYLYLLGI